MAADFVDRPSFSEAALPLNVAAIDGSYHEGSIVDELPSTRIGYVQIGCVLIDMHQYANLRVDGGRFVDPFLVARLEEGNRPLIFTVPSSNVRWGKHRTVRQGVRAALDMHFRSEATQVLPNDPSSRLQSTLFYLASLRDGELATPDRSRLLLHRCPNEGCSATRVEVRDEPTPQTCTACGGPVYAADCLRIWEAVSDFQSNAEALGRIMGALEHLLLVHSVRYIGRDAPSVLAETAFFVDGPLAVFGNAAWLSRAILACLHDTSAEMVSRGHPALLVIGIQKSGQVVDYAQTIAPYVAERRLLSITDEYRYRYIKVGEEATGNGFGSETYYGHDFIYKTESGRTFVFGLHFPFRSQTVQDFRTSKAEIASYPQLPRAVHLIEYMESDLFQDATVPTVLAHRYVAISLIPGGRVLDVLTRKALRRNYEEE